MKSKLITQEQIEKEIERITELAKALEKPTPRERTDFVLNVINPFQVLLRRAVKQRLYVNEPRLQAKFATLQKALCHLL